MCVLWLVNNKHFTVVDFIGDVLSINLSGVFRYLLEGGLNLTFISLLVVEK